jgi:hypothetical protein
VGSRAGLYAVVNRKIPSPYRESNSRSSSPYVGDINAFKVLARRHEEKIPIEITRCKLEDNIKMELEWGMNLWTGFVRLGQGPS